MSSICAVASAAASTIAGLVGDAAVSRRFHFFAAGLAISADTVISRTHLSKYRQVCPALATPEVYAK